MGLISRRRRKKAAIEAERQAETAALELAPRLERAIMTLAVHSQQIDDRLKGLEERFASTDARLEQLPTQADVISVRVHSAQVLTELAAVSLELRSEISRMRDELQPAVSAEPLATTIDLGPTVLVTEVDTAIQPAEQPSKPVIPAALLQQSVADLQNWDTRVDDVRPTDAPSFLRPDSPEFNPETRIIDLEDEPISWGPR